MIVIHLNEGWKVISQYTHGLLAGKLAVRLKPELKPKYWIDTLTGIIEHDDQQLDFDEEDYLTEIGTPQDFAMGAQSKKESLEHAERVYANSIQKSQMIALMVGRHLENLYSDLAKDLKGMREFLNNVKKRRKNQRSLYGISKSDEDAAYAVLLFCDRLSLILCRDQVPEVGREVEINSTIDDQTYYLKRVDDKISIRPWPFDEKSFEVEFEYQILAQSQFDGNSDLRKSMSQSDVELETVQFENMT